MMRLIAVLLLTTMTACFESSHSQISSETAAGEETSQQFFTRVAVRMLDELTVQSFKVQQAQWEKADNAGALVGEFCRLASVQVVERFKIPQHEQQLIADGMLPEVIQSIGVAYFHGLMFGCFKLGDFDSTSQERIARQHVLGDENLTALQDIQSRYYSKKNVYTAAKKAQDAATMVSVIGELQVIQQETCPRVDAMLAAERALESGLNFEQPARFVLVQMRNLAPRFCGVEINEQTVANL